MKFARGSIRRSLRYSLADGLFSSMMLGVTDLCLVPFAVALGATHAQIAVLVGAPPLVGSILQIQSARVTQSIGSRVRLIHVTVLMQAAALLLMLSAPALLPHGPGKPAIWALFAATTLFASFGAFSLPVWQSLMSDYIPVRRRGQYFGWRNRLQGLSMVGTSIAAGVVLDHFGKNNLSGFVVVYGFAACCRLMAWQCLTRHAEPFRKSSHDVYFSFLSFLRQLGTSNFAKFALFVSLMSFAVNVSAPLLTVFLVKGLGLGYLEYTGLVTVAALSGFLFQGRWGAYADRDGNLKALRLMGWGVAVIPLFWLVSRDLLYLFFVQIFAGGVWGGFNLLVTNFIMEAVSPSKRIRCLSYFNVMNSTAVFAGACFGGALFAHLPPLFGYSFLTLFLISCVLRLAVMAFFSERVREVRRLETAEEAHA